MADAGSQNSESAATDGMLPAQLMQEDRSGPVDKIMYSIQRDHIRNGDIILFRGRNVLSRLIRLLTRSNYSHAGIVAWWQDRLMVLEARGSGVVAHRLSHVLEQYNGQVELWTAADDVLAERGKTLDRDRIIASARLHLGKRYGKWKLIVGLRKLIFGTDERTDPVRPPRAFVCSEYVSMVWKSGGVDLSAELDKYTAPSHIAKSVYLRPVGSLQASPRRPDGSPVPASEEPVHLLAEPADPTK